MDTCTNTERADELPGPLHRWVLSLGEQRDPVEERGCRWGLRHLGLPCVHFVWTLEVSRAPGPAASLGLRLFWSLEHSFASKLFCSISNA